ncbi:F-box domain-containing protein [Mariannaea sp. PMI_226]|nr:F-box domain-containing protein [Mariannaea sp. PMI_226]
MNPRVCSCVICGYFIFDDKNPGSHSWLEQFRILYSSPGGVSISGVGVRNDPNSRNWIAPSKSTARWNDEGYDFPDGDQIGVLGQFPRNDRYGFPFHESCWSLLEKAYSPQHVPHKALFEVCRSLPFPPGGNGLSWGCDFDGLLLNKDVDRYPWENHSTTFSNRFHDARVDPYCVPELHQLPSQTPETPPALSLSKAVTKSTNALQALPLEICICIASYLSTVDALNFRQVSRKFLAILHSQQFWASRFRPFGERPWLFESKEWSKAIDWRWLYRVTNKAHFTAGMRNRERVWKLLQRMQRTVAVRKSACPMLSESTPTRHSSSNSANWKWLEASGNLRPESSVGPYHGFGEGCRIFYEQQVSITSHLSRIACSFVQVGDAEYISGMSFTLEQGEVLRLGYHLGEKELALDPESQVEGFILAVGSRGVQGIQCVLENGCTSDWLGSHQQTPKTRRLVGSGPVVAVKAGFDGYKMVSLGVVKSDIQLGEKASSISLWDSAVWYPQIPRAELCLNDDGFTSRDSSAIRYEPLCWTMFGGPGGKYLRNLVGVSVTSWVVPRAIEFHYNINDVPVEYCRVGKINPSNMKVMYFPIDGPRGEVIEDVEVYLQNCPGLDVSWYFPEGILESIKIFTNRGRSYQFRHIRPADPDTLIQKRIKTSPDTTITGFYWNQNDSMLTSLGAISETLPSTH